MNMESRLLRQRRSHDGDDNKGDSWVYLFVESKSNPK